MNPRAEPYTISAAHLSGFLAKSFPERQTLCEECSFEVEECRHWLPCENCTGKKCKKCRGAGIVPCPRCGPFIDYVTINPFGLIVSVPDLRRALQSLVPRDAILMCVDRRRLWFPKPGGSIAEFNPSALEPGKNAHGNYAVYDARNLPLFGAS